MMIIQDPAELLQDVVDEAARLLGSSGAVIDLLDPATGEVHWAYDAGIDDATRAEWQRRGVGGDGVFLAIRERRVVTTDDYAADERFARRGPRTPSSSPRPGSARSRSRRSSARRRCSGTLAVFAAGARPLRADQAATLAALADLATIAIHNAELINELGRSREETARRAETERTLREIAARVTSIREPEAILGLIVDETRRVLGSDGAHLTRMSEDRTFVRPVVIAGGMDAATRDWLQVQEFPLDGGINGLAAGQGRVVWTPNYATDPRIPRDEEDLEVAERMGLGAMAAAPLHAPGGEVIGTLAVSYRKPGSISPDRLGDAPGARRPRGHRPLELGPARPARGVRDELPQPRPGDARRDLAQRRGGPVHVHGRGRRAAVRLDRGRHRRAATSRTSSPRSRRPTRARPGSG